MKRGDLFRVHKGNKNDTKDYRIYLIVSSMITNYVGSLPDAKMEEVNAALRISLAVGEPLDTHS